MPWPSASPPSTAAARTKGTYLNARFLPIQSRRGPEKAALALAASILTAVFSLLRYGVPCQDLGPHCVDRGNKSRAIKRLVRRLHDLGCEVRVAGVG